VVACGPDLTLLDSGLRVAAQLARPTASAYADHGVQLNLGVGFDFGAGLGSSGTPLREPTMTSRSTTSMRAARVIQVAGLPLSDRVS
jgi:hypothetical protein